MIKLITNNGLIKEVPTGISFTFFFFGFLVPLFRGDGKYFLINLAIIIILGFLIVPPLLAWIFFIFSYNDLYIKDLLEKGYKPYDDKAKEYLNGKNWYNG